MDRAILGRLERQPNPAAFDLLVERLKHEDEEVRRGATRALGGLGDPRAVDPLTPLAGPGNSKGEVLEVLSALSKLGPPGKAALYVLLEEGGSIDSALAMLFRQLRDGDAVDPLLLALRRHREDGERDAQELAQALRACAKAAGLEVPDGDISRDPFYWRTVDQERNPVKPKGADGKKKRTKKKR